MTLPESLAAHPAVADFLAEGAEVHLPSGRSPSASLVARVAVAAGLGAGLTFSTPSGPVSAAEARPAVTATANPAAEPLPSIPGATAWPASAATPGMGAALSAHLGIGHLPERVVDFDDVPLRPTLHDDIQVRGQRVPRELANTILEASRVTGADPVLMMAMADKESGFRPDARPDGSTALGLYQFLEGTWLSVVKDFGPKHGLHAEAAAIRTAPDGKRLVEDPEARKRILQMRADPELSTLMACEMHLRAKATLKARIGEEPTKAQSYLAHFMGTSGAGKLIEAARESPQANAVTMFRKAAEANPAIFREGPRKMPRSVKQVTDTMTRMVQSRVDKFVDIEQKLEAAAARAADAPAPRMGR